MSNKLIALIAITLINVSAFADDLILGWSFNRSNGLFHFSYEAEADHLYSLVRYDIARDYFDQPHFFTATNGTNVLVGFDLDPMITGEDLNPSPSGQCWFYLTDITFGESLMQPMFMVSEERMRSAIVAGRHQRPSSFAPVSVPSYLHPASRK